MAGRVFTEERRAAFLGRLRAHGRIGWALEETDTVAGTFYKTRDREPAFERAVQDALLAAAARMVEAAEQDALETLDGGDGRSLLDNKWLLARVTKKADAWRAKAPASQPAAEQVREALERAVLAKLDAVARRLGRERERAEARA